MTNTRAKIAAKVFAPATANQCCGECGFAFFSKPNGKYVYCEHPRAIELTGHRAQETDVWRGTDCPCFTARDPQDKAETQAR